MPYQKWLKPPNLFGGLFLAGDIGSGGWIRTNDLRVMSPTQPYLPGTLSQYRWQETTWPGLSSVTTGMSTEQRSMTKGQRGWKRHPSGGFSGDGTSPVNIISSCSISG